MNKRNKLLRQFLQEIFVLMIGMIFIGCASSSDTFTKNEVNPKIDVYGVKILMDEAQVHENIGIKGEKAMCIYGYEYNYAEKFINIGFNSETSEVRRITTKNPETSIFGITPGVELAKAYELIDLNGFSKDESSKYRFYKENVILSIIAMKGIKADGITIELNPGKK